MTKQMVDDGLQSFTEALMLLTSLTDKRQLDVASPRQRERIVVAVTMLRKCVPMLSSALQTYVKYPHNVQANVRSSYYASFPCMESFPSILTHFPVYFNMFNAIP